MTWSRKLRENYLYIVVGLVAILLISAQLYWMRSSIKLHQTAAERAVQHDIEAAIKEVEEYTYCFSVSSKTYIKGGEQIYIIQQPWKDSSHSIRADTLNLYSLFYDEKDTSFFSKRNMRFNHPVTVDVSLKFRFIENNPTVKIDTNAYILNDIDLSNYKQVLSNRQSLDERMNIEMLDSLIKKALVKNGFDTAYQMGIKHVDARTFEYLRPSTSPAQLTDPDIRISFMGDNFNTAYELYANLHHDLGSTLRSISTGMILSLIIIICLIVSYTYFVRTILNQKKLSEMKNIFISNMTHEFNTPITNINLAVENWRDAPENAPTYINIIDAENKRLERNIEQVLQLSIMEHNNFMNFYEEVNVNDAIEEVMGCLQVKIQSLGGRSELIITDKTLTVEADREQLKKVIYNLMDNAIKYNRRSPEIKLVVTQMQDMIAIRIEDNGIGMYTQTIKNIFERFYRGNDNYRHDVKGFGLGLNYVKCIVEAHKGKITVTSQPGIGSVFTIQLPKTSIKP